MFRKQRTVIVQIDGQVQWLVARDPKDGHWFGVCPLLNMNAAGDTWTEFQECASEAMQVLFEALLENGELEAFLRAHGWSHTPVPARGTPKFEIPYGIEHRQRVEDLVGALA